MLKVVGASWLQTRISTYILVAVGLLGIGAIILGEFGSDEKDGTYSATVFWNHKGGYRIDFWGQGNDLITLPKGAARAYYKTRIRETGWSSVEIETSPSHPDAVQAYAAGLLEGSLTWQLIHHHWFNTIGTICSLEENNEQCNIIREQLRENSVSVREKADLLSTEDPFWHMVRLFYAQLDGLEAGWRFAVRRSRRSVDIQSEDFIWLAMASDVPKEIFKFSSSSESSSFNDNFDVSSNDEKKNGVIFVKSFDRSIEGLGPLVAFAQNTLAPYTKMLRLLKKYTFGYHLSGSRHSPRIPSRSIFMSSYPGALSSQDEYYVIRNGKENDDIFMLAAVPLRDSSKIISASSSVSETSEKNDDNEITIPNIRGIMAAVRIMSANRLANDGNSWSRLLARGNPSGSKRSCGSRSMQWIAMRNRDSKIWLIEQHSGGIRAVDFTKNFVEKGFLYFDGEAILNTNVSRNEMKNDNNDNDDNSTNDFHRSLNSEIDDFFRKNITSIDDIRNLMRGTAKYFNEETIEDRDNSTLNYRDKAKNHESRFVFGPLSDFVFRGDFENPPKPYGIIDNKMALFTSDSFESLEATSGPPYGHEIGATADTAMPFDWLISFPNISRIGQPDKFEFDSVIPEWIWF